MLGTAANRSRTRSRWTPTTRTPSSPTRSRTSADRAVTAHRRREMHDVFIVISEGWGGGHIVRTVYAADHDDARQTHQANYADETLVAAHQQNQPPPSPP